MGKKGIGNIIKKASSSIGKTINAGKQTIKKVTNRIKNKTKSIVNKAKSAVGNSVRGAKALTKNIVNKAKSTIGNAVKATKNTVKKIKNTKENVKELEENILEKLKNQTKDIKENGFFKSVVRGKVTRGAKNYYIKSKEEVIQTLNKKGKGKYGNTKFNDLLNKALEVGKKAGKLLEDTGNYLEKSLKQVIKGSYAGDETNLLGTLGEIGVGCIPVVGQVADIREIVYDVQNWEWKWSNVGDLVLDAVGFVPAIGHGIKALNKVPYKEIGNGIKTGIKKIPNVLESAKNGIKKLTEKSIKKDAQKVSEETSKEFLQKGANAVREGLENIINQLYT